MHRIRNILDPQPPPPHPTVEEEGGGGEGSGVTKRPSTH